MSKPNSEGSSEPEKIVMVVKETEEGSPRVAAIASGAAADALLDKAHSEEVDVVQDEDMIHGLLPAPVEGEVIPVEIYELIASLINFTQELNEVEWDVDDTH